MEGKNAIIEARELPPRPPHTRALLRQGSFTLAACAGVLGAACTVLPPYMALATLSYSSLLAGICLRRNRKLHVPLMAGGILLDLMIVLALEIERNAVKTALSFTLSPLQQLHVGASTVATMLYFPLVYFGYRSWRDGKGASAAHRKLGVAAFAFRTAGFFLMFALLWKKP